MTLHRRQFMAGAAGLAALSPSLGHAQTRWQMATPYADGNLHTRNIRTFIQEVEQATGGRLSIQLHSNGSLLPMPQIKRGVQQGQVQLGEILLTAYANEDVFFDADAIPQLVTNLAEAKKLADLQKPYIEARLARQGLSLLYMVPWPACGRALCAAAHHQPGTIARPTLPHLQPNDHSLRHHHWRQPNLGAGR